MPPKLAAYSTRRRSKIVAGEQEERRCQFALYGRDGQVEAHRDFLERETVARAEQID